MEILELAGYFYKTWPGVNIATAAAEACIQAAKLGISVAFDFNGDVAIASPTSTPDEVATDWALRRQQRQVGAGTWVRP